MKTPREIILQRHQNTEAKLDALRQRVLREQSEATASAPTPFTVDRPNWAGFVMRLWQELVWSCRRVWLGLGAVWLVILTLQLLGADAQAVVKSEPAPFSPSVLEIFRAQRRLAAEFNDSMPLSSPDEPLNATRPRTDRPSCRPAFA